MDSKKEEIGQEIQLELPDYSAMYLEWMKQKEKQEEKQDTVIIIDLY